jgi:chromosome partitioning protein
LTSPPDPVASSRRREAKLYSNSLGDGTSLTTDARRALQGHDLPIAPAAITQRAALAHALIDGHAVTEFEPGGKAAAEVRALWNWIQANAQAS